MQFVHAATGLKLPRKYYISAHIQLQYRETQRRHLKEF